MAKVYINEKTRRDILTRNSTVTFLSIWEDVSMKDCMWERIPRFPIPMVCVTM